ncbi:hypothetical protein QQS21_002880 [Conoideocrella luteorostrata]|uniref:Purine nucleoside permease n=1 Tax=Conoideocrella luteorostrata TaxID=1105319 RepID=A0AAJ0CU80_9HYPO|nr:hypothetical protein QQS21_002880 [Conoideocrella luteorostrata]
MTLSRFLSLFVLYVRCCTSASDFNAATKDVISPQVVIVSMWQPEAQIWYSRFNESKLGNLTAISTAVPGLSMLFPRVFCTEIGKVCQLTLGEGEINSAASMMAFVLSKRFDLRKSYFLFAGIAGVNPHYATIGSVALARYTVQVALQYEIDPRSLPQDWPTGYISYGRDYPLQYPSITYGTEVFEVNDKLREAAYKLASRARLADQRGPQEYRSKYSGVGYRDAMASKAPSVVKCDIATSDVYYSGTKLAIAFENTTEVWTNNTGIYCMSAQEENATLEVMVRGAIEGLVDFARLIILRTGSNFDRPPPQLSDWEHLTRTDQNGFMIAIDNVYNAGVEIVKGIVSDWNCTYKRGIKPSNYIGDIFGSLGGEPDFGFGSLTKGKKVQSGGYNVGLAAVEMGRRERFGLRAMLK